jgi:hypothetical protein
MLYVSPTPFAQGRDPFEDEYTGRPRRIRTELKIQEVAMSMYANHSQMVAAAAAGIIHDTDHKIMSDDLNMSYVT